MITKLLHEEQIAIAKAVTKGKLLWGIFMNSYFTLFQHVWEIVCPLFFIMATVRGWLSTCGSL